MASWSFQSTWLFFSVLCIQYQLDQFCIAVVINHHKCNGDYNNTNLFYSFVAQKYEMSLTGLKSKCQQGWFLSEGPGGEFLFLSSRSHLHFFPCDTFLCFQSQQHHHPHIFLWILLFCLPLLSLTDTVIALGLLDDSG